MLQQLSLMFDKHNNENLSKKNLETAIKYKPICKKSFDGFEATRFELDEAGLFASSSKPIRTTSIEAHESIKSDKQRQYDLILEGLRKVKDATSEELSEIIDLEYAQIHKRLPELVVAGKVVNTGEERKNKSGRSAMVRRIV